MDKVSCQKKGTLITLDEAQMLFHIVDEICSLCTNYETCKKEFWNQRTVKG